MLASTIPRTVTASLRYARSSVEPPRPPTRSGQPMRAHPASKVRRRTLAICAMWSSSVATPPFFDGSVSGASSSACSSSQTSSSRRNWSSSNGGDQPAISRAPHGPLVAVLVGDRARLAEPLDLTAGDLHPERGATAELEHLDAVGAGLVRVRRVGRHEEPVARVQHLRPHLQRAGDDVVEAVAVVGVARQHVVRTEPGAHEAEAVVAFAAVHDRVVRAGDEVRRARTVGGERGAIVGVELGCAHGPRLEETRRVLAPEQLDALLVGHAVHRGTPGRGDPRSGQVPGEVVGVGDVERRREQPGDAGVGPPLLEHRSQRGRRPPPGRRRGTGR